jgi:actin-like ATPase involved in cell morphogenesis
MSFPADIELAGIKEKLDAGMISEAEAATRIASIKVRENLSLSTDDDSDVAAQAAAPAEPPAVFVLGIDFGTTQITVAVGEATRLPKPVVVANELGNQSTPPTVGFHGNRRMVGESAVAMATRYPRDTVARLKPFLGGAEASTHVHTKHHTDESSGAIVFSVNYAGGERQFSPEQCLVMLLANVKRLAATRCELRGADDAALAAWHPYTVISLPSNSDRASQLATLRAARAAGFDAHLCRDGAALAAAYATVHGSHGPSNTGVAANVDGGVRVLIVDAGDSGATVALVDVGADRRARVVAERRTVVFAGAHMTSNLVEHVRKQFGHADAFTAKAHVRLQQEAAKQKAVLSTVDRAEVRLENFVEDRDLACRVSRAELVALSEAELAALATTIGDVLSAVPEAERVPLHAVELVGGASRVPAVRERVAAATKAECAQGGRTLDSASTVALGAAILAVQRAGAGSGVDIDAGAANGAAGVPWAAAADVGAEAGAVDALRAVEAECRARDLLVASVMNARNAFEAALLRVRERFDDAAFKSVLAAPRGALTAQLNAEQEWLDEQAGDDEGNEDEARRDLYAQRLAAFEAALARSAPEYVALCEEKRKAAERDRAEAEENARRVAHSSNTNAPRTNKQRLAAADLQKKGGTIAFKDHDFKSAARHFLDGVQLLSGCRDMSPETTAQVNELQLSMLLNLSMCFLKLEKWTKVIDNCSEALKIDAANGKALFRRATAYEQQGEIDKALADAKLATPKDDAAIVALIRRMEARIAKRSENEKKMYAKMFS